MVRGPGRAACTRSRDGWASNPGNGSVAPAVGLEPTTKRLTAARSTTELRRSEDARVSGEPVPQRVVGARSAPRDRIARGSAGQAVRALRSRNPATTWVMPRMTSQIPPMNASVTAEEIG